ncbi:energy transducer TonB [Sphingorhabdus sp.]|uniref:energy transducer TonB n=2 Tax=Sphingorhabdus sp. TaxID=1902408 RepID=UPI0032B795FE
MPYWFLLGTAIAASAPLSTTETITTVPVVDAPPPPLISASPVPPTPGKPSVAVPKDNPGSWATTNDYPTRALSERREGTTGFKLSIDTIGSPTVCTITQSSGHADLDEATCSNIVRRARFFPAQDGKGRAIQGEWASRVRWQIPTVFSTASQTIADRSFPRPPRVANYKLLQIKEADYPADALLEGFQGRSEIVLSISTSGLVTNCNIAKTSGHMSLDQKSCDLARNWKFNPATGKDGSAVEGFSAHSFDWRLPKGSHGVPPAPVTVRNPFEKPGTMTLTLDFDSEGKLANCQSEYSGEFSFLPKGMMTPEQMCKNAPTGRVKPFVDKDGKDEPRRVILKFELTHQELPASLTTTEAN